MAFKTEFARELGGQLASTLTPTTKPGLTRRFGTVTAKTFTSGGTLLTVDVAGGTLEGVRATNAAAVCAIGSRVVLETVGNLTLATGIINQGATRSATNLWQGTWSSGSITIPGLSSFTLFGAYLGSYSTRPIGWCYDSWTTFRLSASFINTYGDLEVLTLAASRSGDTLTLLPAQTGMWNSSAGFTQKAVTRIYALV